MKRFWRVLRWIIVILAATNVIGYLMTLATSKPNASELWLALFWVYIGATTLFFELKSAKEQRKSSKGLLIVLGVLVAILVGLIFTNAATGNLGKNTQTDLQQPQPAQPVTADGLYIAINKVRATNNLPAFARNPQLDKSAKMKCSDMVKYNYYNHKHPKTRMNGYDYVDKTVKYYDWVSENLNAGMFANSQEVIDSWMGSESHAASILDPRFTEIGFATCEVAIYSGETVIVQHKIDP